MSHFPLLLCTLAVSQAADHNIVRGIKPDRGGKVQMRPGAPIRRAPTKPVSPAWAFTDSVTESMRMCGANCLFVWLRLRNADCQLERLRKEVPLSERGSNMADLAEVAHKYGEDARIVEGSSTAFANHVPFIARMKSITEGLHHFVVVTRIRPKEVEVIDGTSGRVDAMPISKFFERFAGEAIIGVGIERRISPRLVGGPVTNLAVRLLMLISVIELAGVGILLTKQLTTGKR